MMKKGEWMLEGEVVFIPPSGRWRAMLDDCLDSLANGAVGGRKEG
jgi:hypothetical protein